MKDSGRTEELDSVLDADVTSGGEKIPRGSAAAATAPGPALGAVVAYDTRLIEGARVAKLTTIAPR